MEDGLKEAAQEFRDYAWAEALKNERISAARDQCIRDIVLLGEPTKESLTEMDEAIRSHMEDKWRMA